MCFTRRAPGRGAFLGYLKRGPLNPFHVTNSMSPEMPPFQHLLHPLLTRQLIVGHYSCAIAISVLLIFCLLVCVLWLSADVMLMGL